MTTPPVKQETFTTRQPDGTFVTHTTTVKEKIVEDTEFTFGGGQINEEYCCKPEGIVRILEIVSFSFYCFKEIVIFRLSLSLLFA